MVDVDADDKYTAAIEVSNACRMFYVSRLQTAETLKDRLVDRRRAVREAAASSPPRGPDHLPGTVDDIAALEADVARLHKELVSLHSAVAVRKYVKYDIINARQSKNLL